MREDLVRVLDGNSFVLSDMNGDIEASPSIPTGMFSFDTRYLSCWQLTVNGERLTPLSVDESEYFSVVFFLVPGAPTVYVDAKVSVIRRRSIGGSFREKLTLLNHSREPAEFTVRIEAASDFADLFEIKDPTHKKGTTTARVDGKQLRLTYQRETFRRETVISSTEPAQFDERGLTFEVRIGPHQQWDTELLVETLGPDGKDIRASLHRRASRPASVMRQNLDDWISAAPTLGCDHVPLVEAYRRSLIDLAALRFPPLAPADLSLPAAGLPWFMTAFGRDSIFTSLQALPFVPSLAFGTLQVLGDGQGTRLDDFREEEPGKIYHEVRYGETSAFGEQPHSPYYGAADTTALFVILLHEYELWTGDADAVRRWERRARAALEWIDGYGDLLGNGYVSYQRRNSETGLENQCWKDSWDSISYHDGRMPGFPRATCELQGYAYDAKIRGAQLARKFWNDHDYADRLERDAAELKRRFNRDFWVEDGEYYALALDREGKPVDALSSNMGHLLWSGIVEQDRARRVVDHLLGPNLFSGWGIRTLATTEGRYNPVGYHNGTVWPFDNSFIAWGMRRYGFKEEACRIAEAMIDAAEYFGGRLPEAFAGYDRGLTQYPVHYPTACSPQAWSTGAILLLIRTMLGMQPRDNHLLVEPALPPKIGRIELLDVPGRWGHADAFGRRRPETAV
ncbi:MAG: amylo-alpha-1,6-glucosidase [Micromonosporaceae bacterium]|jgi:glycogen debranching enzyme|nr:amylo-alpha-1,6-glucosidase [Micromonosporaceae bacterium]